MSDTFIYGVHAVESMLERAPHRLRQVFVSNERHDLRLQILAAKIQSQGIAIQGVKRQFLESKTSGAVHQGLVAAIIPEQGHREQDLPAILDLSPTPLLLVFDGVTDPHNLGACWRSAGAAGVQAIIVPRDRAVRPNATVRKVACGATECVPLVMVTNLARTLRYLKERGIWVVGTSGLAPQTIYQSQLTGPLALVMGSEGQGMRRLTEEQCDTIVSLPTVGSMPTLNVSVATGICLFEAIRQRIALASC